MYLAGIQRSAFPKLHNILMTLILQKFTKGFDLFLRKLIASTLATRDSHKSSVEDFYILEDWQILKCLDLQGTATNTFITSPLLRATYWPNHTVRMSYSTDTSEASKKNQAAVPLSARLTQRQRFRLMLRDYGGTLLAFHITISLISLGGCYMVVISGIDVTPFVQMWTSGNEQVESLMKVSTDFIIAYTVHKLLAPVRIGMSLSVTPMIVKRLRKMGLLKLPKLKPPPPTSS